LFEHEIYKEEEWQRMSRLEIDSPSRADIVIEGLYKDLERRIESSPPGLCPVDMARAFLELCHAQTCGKCVPCRIGLGQLNHLIKDVLDGKATMETLNIMEKTAVSIMESADCAIGYEAAHMVYKGLIGYRDDYIEHIERGRCICTYSQPVPCVSLCPARVDIPGYIALVRDGRYSDAIRLIRKDNPFPTTCGFICEHPCEARCRRNMVDDAINIRGLKRVAADFAGEVEPPACAESTGKKVAVLGGGPCGLSAAYYLQLMGHQTTVYEMLPKLGGMLRYGIPNYRLPKNRLDDDINSILKTGVKVKYGIKVGTDITIQEIQKEYDAVLIAVGASTDKKLGIEGEDADGVLSAVEFLRDVGMNQIMDLSGKEVAVIGGGNVSMDAVRTAKRLGAKKVSIVYRRRIADMTALHDEIEGAIAEGIEVQTLKAPASIDLDENNHVKGIYVTPQMVSEIRDGRASIRPTGEENVYIPCDVLIVAIGQNIETKHFEDAGVPVSRGKIITTSTGAFKGMPGVFAGGDSASGPATVIKAIAAAKVVAANIDEYLGYHHVITCDVEIPIPNIDDRTPCGRVNLTEREAGIRVCDFEGVENCMTEKEAKQEANRCLRCDHFGYGIFKGGREKLW
jgi:NADPH-dependent glutamate synthase beta subunit-like oxidoreductase